MEPDSESKTGLQGNPETYEIMESNQNDIEYYVVEEARGFNTDTYTKLISQMHMYTQSGIQINQIFNIDIDIAPAIYCKINILIEQYIARNWNFFLFKI